MIETSLLKIKIKLLMSGEKKLTFQNEKLNFSVNKSIMK